MGEAGVGVLPHRLLCAAAVLEHQLVSHGTRHTVLLQELPGTSVTCDVAPVVTHCSKANLPGKHMF